MKKSTIAGLVAALFAGSAMAFDPFVVKDIRVEGIQRTEAGTVFSYLPVKVGETMTDDKAAQAVKALFATGFFKDVRLEIEGQVVVVILDERPAIAAVDFTGLKVFKKEDILKGFREVGLVESRIFDRSLLEKAEKELKRQYVSMGHYAAEVTTTVTPLERNRVGINFAVDEGPVAKIRQINIVGATAFSEKNLLDEFVLRTPGLFTWYTKNDQYSKQKLSGDLEKLRSFYLDRGYLEFSIDSTQVSITPDKRDIYISISITEGEKYTIKSVSLAGDLLLPQEELVKLVATKPGEDFSREKITQTTKAISDRLGNEGYAFANVNAVPEIDKAKREVAFTILLDPGRRTYVRQVNITGNTRTRDEVIRRELRQMEASWYEGDKINKSRARVDKLGYFDEVTVETPPVPGTTDQVDVNINVKEKPTGNVMLGAGFSSSEKFMLSGSVSQQNLFGSGKTVGVGLNTSKVNKVYSFSYTDPYNTLDGISRGFDVYHRNVDTTSLTVGYFGSRSTGAGVRYGLPIGEDDSVAVGLAVDSTRLRVTTLSPIRYQQYVQEFGESSTTLLANAGWAKDTLDSRIYPTTGSVWRLNGEMAIPPARQRYYKTSAQHQRFMSLGRSLTLALNGEIGLANGYGGKQLPFFKNYYAGGIGSVRGYDASSLGPTDPVTQERLGGTKRLVGNAELLFPMPGSGLDKSVRLGVFLDAGQVWGYGEKMSLGSLRYSTGVSLAWSSPLGPLKFSLGQPLKKKPEDKVQRLQFQMGTTF